ncbi:MAG: hypothetical protein Q8R02_08915 [Hyphomonadaceae bacterium]|nr:hypothetical protein [Hyphomonadaceae bacterium]
MIFVDRAEVSVPASMRSDKTLAAYNAIADVIGKTRRRRPTINFGIFKTREVKTALKMLFAGKCAYCETPDDGAHGVDHFRPHTSAAGFSGETSVHYYAWLAYEWGNLVYACTTCMNSTENMFPVTGERAPILASFPKFGNGGQFTPIMSV